MARSGRKYLQIAASMVADRDLADQLRTLFTGQGVEEARQLAHVSE